MTNTGLIIHTKEAKPFQYVVIQLPKDVKADDKTRLDVSIGAIQNIATRYISTELDNNHGEGKYYAYQVLMPDLVAGKYTIRVNAAGTNYEGDISISALTGSGDPELYFNTYITDVTEDFKTITDGYNARVSDGTLKQSTADSMKNILNAAAAEIQSLYADLNAEEKKIYVQMLEANRPWLDEYLAVANQYPLRTLRSNGNDPCAGIREDYQNAVDLQRYADMDRYSIDLRYCEAEQTQIKLQATNGYLGRLSAAHEAAKESFTSTSGVFRATKAFIKTFFSHASSGVWEEFKQVNNISDVNFGLESLEDAKQKSELQFEYAKEYNLSAGVRVVNISREHANTIPFFRKIVDGVDFYNNTLGKLAEWLGVVPQITLPQSRSEKMYVSNFTIEDITNDVMYDLEPGGEGKVVTFYHNITGPEDRPFSFRMKVSTPYGTVQNTVSANLFFPPPPKSMMDILKSKKWTATYITHPEPDSYSFTGCNALTSSCTRQKDYIDHSCGKWRWHTYKWSHLNIEYTGTDDNFEISYSQDIDFPTVTNCQENGTDQVTWSTDAVYAVKIDQYPSGINYIYGTQSHDPNAESSVGWDIIEITDNKIVMGTRSEGWIGFPNSKYQKYIVLE